MRKMSEIPGLLDWSDLFIGFILFISPWALGFSDIDVAAWNAWIAGLIIAIAATYSLFVALKEWEHWNGVILGIWLMAAPFMLGFAPIKSAAAVHLVLGALLIVSEVREIWTYRHHPHDDRALTA